ncbi:MAG: polyprenyl synthetase family protein [Nitrososphaerota archaeon]|nr:polyprenyl synthetase family protein [Nitrososphaerota archaeon]
MNYKEVEPIVMKRTAYKMPTFEAELINTLKRHNNNGLFMPFLKTVEGGKRLRPLLMLLINEACGTLVNPLDAAQAIEILHTISLIHDDIIDKEKSRRDDSPFYIKYGRDKAIIAADFAFGLVMELLAKYNEHIMKTVANASTEMSQGELIEVVFMKKRKISLADYIRVIKMKTASLFAATCEIGAALSKREEMGQEMKEFGELLGLIYQIRDDQEDQGKKGELINVLDSAERGKLQDYMITLINNAQNHLQKLDDSDAKTYIEHILALISDVPGPLHLTPK